MTGMSKVIAQLTNAVWQQRWQELVRQHKEHQRRIMAAAPSAGQKEQGE